MFIRVTNARTGRKVTLNPSMIGFVDDRSGDPNYQNTKAAVILNDARNTFIPTTETEEQIYVMIERAASTQRRSVMDTRSPPPVSDDDPGPQPR